VYKKNKVKIIYTREGKCHCKLLGLNVVILSLYEINA
jgi:hypothetical protein